MARASAAATVKQSDLDTAECEAMKAIAVIRAFFNDRASYRDARQAQKAFTRYVRLCARMVAQERRARGVRVRQRTGIDEC